MKAQSFRGHFGLMICSFFAVLFMTAFTNAQTVTDIYNDTKVINYTIGVAGTTTYNSNSFQISRIINSDIYTHPLNITVYLSGGTASTQKVTAYFLGAEVDSSIFYAVIDTISVSDSSITALHKFLNLNGHAPRYGKMQVIGTSGNVSTLARYLITAKKE